MPKQIGYTIKTSSVLSRSIFGNKISNNMFMANLVDGDIDKSGLYGIGMWSYAVFNTTFVSGAYYVTIPILQTVPEVTVVAFPLEISMVSVTNSSHLIQFVIEFYDIHDNLIIIYNQSTSGYMWDKSSGYQSGELAVFSLPESSPVFDIGTYGQIVKFKLRGFNVDAASGYSEMYELRLTDLIPYAPELLEDDAVADHSQIFRWISASDLPLLAHELNYNLEIYSSTSSLSSLYAFSFISALNSVSYWSTLSGLQQSGLLNVLLSESGIAGQISFTYWALMSHLSAGSYFARVGVWDSGISAMIWSMFSPFSVGHDIYTKDLILRPGFNLYSIPLHDMDADTARRLVEDKVGYKVVEGSLVPYLSEVIKWKEEAEENNKWESVAASKSGYNLKSDFDIEANKGYFINLNNSESIVVRFRGESW